MQPVKSFLQKNLIYEYVKAKADYTAQKPEELTFKKGDTMKIVNRNSGTPGWWTANLNGTVGLFNVQMTQYVDTKSQPSAINNGNDNQRDLGQNCSGTECSKAIDLNNKGGGGGVTFMMRSAKGNPPPPPKDTSMTSAMAQELATVLNALKIKPPNHCNVPNAQKLMEQLHKCRDQSLDWFAKSKDRLIKLEQMINEQTAQTNTLAESTTDGIANLRKESDKTLHEIGQLHV